MQQFPDIGPSESSVMRRHMDVLETRFGDGAVQRMPRHGAATPMREWHVVFTHINSAQAIKIDRFLESHKGVAPFRWVPPGGRSGYYLCTSWQVTPAPSGLASLRAVFTETAAS